MTLHGDIHIAPLDSGVTVNKPINQNFFENENEYSIFYICKHIHSNIGTNAGKHSDSKIKALSV